MLCPAAGASLDRGDSFCLNCGIPGKSDDANDSPCCSATRSGSLLAGFFVIGMTLRYKPIMDNFTPTTWCGAC